MNNSIKIFDSEKTLSALREIQSNPQITQRDLAKKLDISLGKSNFLIRSLIDKGIIEIKNFKNSKNKLAYMYLLTPQGIKVKIHLTHKFFVSKSEEYEKLKEEMERIRREDPVILSEKEPV